jgi:hypothetical protein
VKGELRTAAQNISGHSPNGDHPQIAFAFSLDENPGSITSQFDWWHTYGFHPVDLIIHSVAVGEGQRFGARDLIGVLVDDPIQGIKRVTYPI